MKQRLFITGILTSLLISSSGCSAPKLGSVQAEEGRPDSAQVNMVSIPYNPNKPKIVMVVEPFKTSSSVVTFTHGEAGSVPIADKMSAQLVTALSNVGNFQLYDNWSSKKISVKKGEKGPYVLRATLTEFNEVADAESEETDISLGGIGAVAGIAGAVSGNNALMWSGAGLAAANPGYNESASRKKGMVAFDVQIIERGTGRIVRSFDCAGTFKAESASNGISLFGISNSKAKFQQSVLGQALRVAMNDAVKKTADALL